MGKYKQYYRRKRGGERKKHSKGFYRLWDLPLSPHPTDRSEGSRAGMLAPSHRKKSDDYPYSFYGYCEVVAASLPAPALPAGAEGGRGGPRRLGSPAGRDTRLTPQGGTPPGECHAAEKAFPRGRQGLRDEATWGLTDPWGGGGGKGPPQPLLRAAPRGGLNAKGRRRGMRSSGGCGAPRPPRRQPARQGSGPAAAASALPGTAAGCQAAAPAGDGAEGRPAAALPRPACSPPSRSACGRGERSLLRRDGQPSAAQPQAPLGLKSPWLRGPGGAATSKWHGRETVEVKASHH